MAFKKIDSTAVNSTTSKPLDSGVLVQECSNVDEAYEKRLSRTSCAYPVGARPVLSGAVQMFYPLTYYRPKKDVKQIKFRFRGLATSTGSDVAIRARIVAVDTDTTQYFGDQAAYTTISNSASDQVLTLTFDSTHVHSRRLLYGVMVVSDEISGTQVDDTDAIPANVISHNGRRVDLSGVSFTFSDTKRWKLKFGRGVNGAGADVDIEEEPPTYPPTQLIRSLGGDNYTVFPSLPDSIDRVYTRLKISTVEIGRFDMYGWSIEESQVEEKTSLGGSFRPAKEPSGFKFSALYARQYDLWRNRTRIHHAGGSPRVGKVETTSGLIVNPYNAWYEYSNSEEDIAACWAGDLATHRISSNTASDVYRRRYLVVGVVCVVYNHVRTEVPQYQVSLGADIHSFTTGSGWVASETTMDIDHRFMNYPVQALPSFGPRSTLVESANALNYRKATEGVLAWHHLRGALLGKDIVMSQMEMHGFGFEIRESTGQQASTARMLTLRIKGSSESANGIAYDSLSPPIVHLLTWNVEELKGTA